MPISQAMWRYQKEWYQEQCHISCYILDDRVITIIYIHSSSIYYESRYSDNIYLMSDKMNELKSILIAHLDGKNFPVSMSLRFKGI